MPDTSDVQGFFDKQASVYRKAEAGMRRQHATAVQLMEPHLRGAVLAIGGLWREASTVHDHPTVVAVDVSAHMLRTEKGEATAVQAPRGHRR